MGLNADISSDIALAFNTDLSDAVRSFNGINVALGATYDPVTDSYPKTTTSYAGRGVFGHFRLSEIDKINVLQTDTKLICLQDEVLSGTMPFIPMIGDKINEYTIVNVGKDPANVSFTIQLRLT